MKHRTFAFYTSTRFLFLSLIGLLIISSALLCVRTAPVKAQAESKLAPEVVVFSENFDSVIPPALPAGWTTSASGQITSFTSVSTFPDSPPNAAYTDDPNTQGTTMLISPSIALGNLPHKVTFRNFYQTDFEFDGCVLELSINGGAFTDIVAAGGTFTSGGYDTQLVASSLSGRMAWTGTRAGYLTTEVMLPASTNNQSIRLRWVLATDNMEAGTGWRIDNVEVSNAISGTNLNAITIPASGAASIYPSDITLSGLNGLVTGVQVSLTNFSHTLPDDVDLMLVAPNGRKVMLMSDAGGSNSVTNLNLFFTDAAGSSLPDSTTITSGNYRPTDFETGDTFPAPAPGGAPTGSKLSALNGIDPNGTWHLYLVDDNGNNAGSISGGWLLFIQSSPDAIALPDIGAATPYASQKTILGMQGTITKVTITLSNFSHTVPDDADVMLVAPNGRRILLMSDVGGTTEVGGLNLTFDDDAVAGLPDNAPLSTGTFKPTDFEAGDAFPAPAPQGAVTGTTLNAFYGSAPTGTWKLYAVNDTGGHVGSIAGSWSLNLQTSTTACAFTLAPSEQTFPITGGNGSFAINMPSACSWMVTGTSGFITLNSSASGSGNGSIDFAVAPNMSGGRAGTIDVSNGVVTRTFQVQQPSGCPFSLNQTSFNIGGAGGPGNVGVTAGNVCTWQASTTANWIQITSNAQVGNGAVVFTVQPNPTSTARSATVTVGARSFTVNQAGAGGRKFDFDGDLKDDVAVFRPSNNFWYVSQSTAGFRSTQFGSSGDRITPGDFDGDGKADVAVFRASTGFWYVLRSSDNTLFAQSQGQAGDIPATGDYDADGKSDLAVYRPSDGTFYFRYSSDNTFHFQQWGANGDKPVSGDYDGDGKTDLAVFRPSIGTFYILQSSNGAVRGQQFGQNGDNPLAADFDADGKTDIGVYRPTTGSWYYLNSSDNSFRGVAWGASGDIPSTADYDGDGKWDVTVFRPTTGVFYILQSTNNSLRADQFGTSGDVPVASAYIQ